MRTGEGTLLPERRSQIKSEENDYILCHHCKSMFKKKLFWVHEKKCNLNKGAKTTRRVLIDTVIKFNNSSEKYSESFTSNIISGKNPDKITNLMINDEVIMNFGRE